MLSSDGKSIGKAYTVEEVSNQVYIKGKHKTL